MSLDVSLREVRLVIFDVPHVLVCTDPVNLEHFEPLRLKEQHKRMGLDAYAVEKIPAVVEVFEGNITHNLTAMADSVGLYKPMWRPEECGIERAKDLIEPLRKGLRLLKIAPEASKKHNPKNGWGSYENLVEFTQRYLDACKAHPDAFVSTYR